MRSTLYEERTKLTQRVQEISEIVAKIVLREQKVEVREETVIQKER